MISVDPDPDPSNSIRAQTFLGAFAGSRRPCVRLMNTIPGAEPESTEQLKAAFVSICQEDLIGWHLLASQTPDVFVSILFRPPAQLGVFLYLY